jgi:hypothetical protein
MRADAKRWCGRGREEIHRLPPDEDKFVRNAMWEYSAG